MTDYVGKVILKLKPIDDLALNAGCGSPMQSDPVQMHRLQAIGPNCNSKYLDRLFAILF